MDEVKKKEGRAIVGWEQFKISFYYLSAYLLIIFGYYYYIVPIYGYSGFEWAPDKLKILESILLVVVLPLFLPASFKKPSDILLHLQLLFPIIPMIVLYGAAESSRQFLYFTIMAYLLIVLIVSKVHIKAIRVSKVSPLLFGRILLALSWAGVGSIVLFGGLKYFNINLSKVYDFRSESAANLPAIYGYVSPLVSKVLLPFSLLLAALNKDRFLAMGAIVGSIMMFGLTAHKGPLFYPFAVLALYYILNKKNSIRKLLIGYVAIVCISLIDLVLGGAWIGSLMLRRVYLVPAHLNYIYHDYFSSNPYYLWSKSKISFGLSESKYSLDPSHLIGLEYYGSELTGANTGWIGSGYMNAGIFGVLLYAIIIALFFAMLNGYSRSIDKRIIVAITAAPMLTVLMSSDLPTAFLNHGVILSLVLFSLFSVRQRSVLPHAVRMGAR